MQIYEELVARGLIAQVTNEEEIKKMVNNGQATFYIGFDPTADSLHVGHFMALCLMKRLICFLKHSQLCSMVSTVIICLMSVRPEGSPIMPVPPPTRAMGLLPAICSLFIRQSAMKWPTWRLSAVGSNPM